MLGELKTVGVGRIPQSSLSGSARIVNTYCKLSKDKTDFLALQLTFGIGHQDAWTQPCEYMSRFRLLCLEAENAPHHMF